MKFRPCIDIHNGKVKQIVGGSLVDQDNQAKTNFTSENDAPYYAMQYKEAELQGGHIIMLNSKDSTYYKETREQALMALQTYPNGMQIGGGITLENAMEYIAQGASHVIVTSYIFEEGEIKWENLKNLAQAIGPNKIVIDLSCRKKEKDYYIVTNRWQVFTKVRLTHELLDAFSEYCAEFLIHGVDVEGKAAGIEKELVELLGQWNRRPITYAGGIGSLEDLQEFQKLGEDKLDFTIGSALDLFGGKIPYDIIKKYK